MKVIKREYLKLNLASVLAECKETSNPVLITSTTKQDNPMVLITQIQYDMMLSGLDNKGKV